MQPPDIPALLAQVVNQFQEFSSSLQTRPSKSGWFRNILIRLSQHTLQEYESLVNSGSRPINHAAWASRNLLELDIFTRDALLSEHCAKRFYEDRLVDAGQLFTAFKEFQLHLNHNSDVSPLDKMLKLIDDTKKNDAVTHTKYLQASDLAGQVGMDTEFKKMNKICSKLVHPTAWSIFLDTDSSGLRSILLMAGQQYMANVYGNLKGHVDKFGVEPQA